MKRALVTALLLVLAASCKKAGDGDSPSEDSVGVPECDAYVTKYQACLAKMAPGGQESAKQGCAAQRATFRASATTPDGKAKLAAQCKAALDAIRPTCP